MIYLCDNNCADNGDGGKVSTGGFERSHELKAFGSSLSDVLELELLQIRIKTLSFQIISLLALYAEMRCKVKCPAGENVLPLSTMKCFKTLK